jgi:hypothetical protein
MMSYRPIKVYWNFGGIHYLYVDCCICAEQATRKLNLDYHLFFDLCRFLSISLTLKSWWISFALNVILSQRIVTNVETLVYSSFQSLFRVVNKFGTFKMARERDIWYIPFRVSCYILFHSFMSELVISMVTVQYEIVFREMYCLLWALFTCQLSSSHLSHTWLELIQTINL